MEGSEQGVNKESVEISGKIARTSGNELARGRRADILNTAVRSLGPLPREYNFAMRTPRMVQTLGATLLISFCLQCQGATKHDEVTADLAAGLSDEELMHLQYYSDQFDLVRLISSGRDKRGSGRLITRDGSTFEVIHFKMGTPGVATYISKRNPGGYRSIRVSFEAGCEINFRAPDVSGVDGLFTAFGDLEYCGQRYRVIRDADGFMKSRGGGAMQRFLANPQMNTPLQKDVTTELFVDFKPVNDGANKRVVPGRRVEGK
jgi:hypothetical protein